MLTGLSQPFYYYHLFYFSREIFLDMKNLLYFCVFASAAAATVHAQTPRTGSTPKPSLVIVTNTMPPTSRAATAPRATPTPIIVGGNKTTQPSGPAGGDNQRTTLTVRPRNVDEPADRNTGMSKEGTAAERVLTFGEIKSKIAAAKRSMLGRPITIASVDSPLSNELVRVAFHDWDNAEIDYVVMTKVAFLSTKEEKVTTSENGKTMRIRTIRGNGVNTPIVLTDMQGKAHVPLLVQYPVVRGGKYYETAYYMSTHPGLVTPEVVNAGRTYVHNVIELARQKLDEKGIIIQPKVADIAERLATVEHVDHLRFRNEYHPNIYNDIFTLFALNEGGTYRYSVSSAGAGGMVQMIPSTYRMVRAQFPTVGLMPDFVEGMRDHTNAAQAMLLYMQWTWRDLLARPTIADALVNNIATQEQLMAAGYNSNPARLSGYISRAGANWVNLIPRETKIYLQIYESVDKHVPMTPRKR